MALSDQIKFLRKQMGLTQQELADRIWVAKSTVSYYESGDRTPPYDILVKLADTCHVTTDFLLEVHHARTIDVSDMSDKEVAAILSVIDCIKAAKGPQDNAS